MEQKTKTPLLDELSQLDGTPVNLLSLHKEIEELVESNGGEIPKSMFSFILLTIRNDTKKKMTLCYTDSIYFKMKSIVENEFVKSAIEDGDEITIAISSTGKSEDQMLAAQDMMWVYYLTENEYKPWLEPFHGKVAPKFNKQYIKSLFLRTRGSIPAETAVQFYSMNLMYGSLPEFFRKRKAIVAIIHKSATHYAIKAFEVDDSTNPFASAIDFIISEGLMLAAAKGEITIKVIGEDEKRFLGYNKKMSLSETMKHELKIHNEK